MNFCPVTRYQKIATYNNVIYDITQALNNNSLIVKLQFATKFAEIFALFVYSRENFNTNNIRAKEVEVINSRKRSENLLTFESR